MHQTATDRGLQGSLQVDQLFQFAGNKGFLALVLKPGQYLLQLVTLAPPLASAREKQESFDLSAREAFISEDLFFTITHTFVSITFKDSNCIPKIQHGI